MPGAQLAVGVDPAGRADSDQESIGRLEDGSFVTVGAESPPVTGEPLPVVAQHERVRVLGCTIDRVTLEEGLEYCDAVIQTRGFAQHMAVNAAKLVALQRDEVLRKSIERCELITADGQPIVWASRLLGNPLPCRVAGIDLMEGLLARAAEKGYRVYILGAKDEVLERAVERMQNNFPRLLICGHQNGYYDQADEPAVAAEIAAARPDILFVAMSSPRKEYFLARHGQALDVPFLMGVGGSIDVYAGLVKRAPVLLQHVGLEWLFRLAQEPRRLAKRYVKTNTQFLLMLVRELLRVRFRLGGSDTVA